MRLARALPDQECIRWPENDITPESYQGDTVLINMLPKFSIFLLTGLLSAGSGYAEGLDYRYIELAYSENNPDEKSLENGTGFTLSGSVPLAGRLYGFGRFNHAEADLCWEECPLQTRTIHTMDDWLVLGLGYHWPLKENTDLTAAIDYQSVELDGSREHGGGVLLGIRTRPADRWDLSFQIGYFNLEFDDFQLVGEVAYKISERLDVVGRLRDFNDWDYSSYEGGVRYRF